MKYKHDPALLRTSDLSNEIVKRPPKSQGTIPLNGLAESCKVLTCLFHENFYTSLIVPKIILYSVQDILITNFKLTLSS
jgi:hypothetical protein